MNFKGKVVFEDFNILSLKKVEFLKFEKKVRIKKNIFTINIFKLKQFFFYFYKLEIFLQNSKLFFNSNSFSNLTYLKFEKSI